MLSVHHLTLLSTAWLDASSESEVLMGYVQFCRVLVAYKMFRGALTNWDPAANLNWARITNNGIAFVGVCPCDVPVALG